MPSRTPVPKCKSCSHVDQAVTNANRMNLRTSTNSLLSADKGQTIPNSSCVVTSRSRKWKSAGCVVTRYSEQSLMSLLDSQGANEACRSKLYRHFGFGTGAEGSEWHKSGPWLKYV
ncbi:hypothetical protein EG68_06222 [Paragonimus skrjabini miyazakii]|uniref:Uncharacterized protein n=1 Tax=Paragonimus skrjabini miyazakii TaxID=59628 RepID=A0A8S9YYL4_9TREM|nr:hypothetical protein EG68_06222 [Paragonimus skrjabini miyazakii]